MIKNSIRCLVLNRLMSLSSRFSSYRPKRVIRFTPSHAFSVIVKGKQAEGVTIDGVMSPLDDDNEDMVDMFTEGPAGVEWGGPTRGGKYPEPTRYGDWEQKGRVSDF